MVTGEITGTLHAIDTELESQKFFKLLQAIEAELVDSAHDLSEGGLAVGLVESTFSSGLGLEVALKTMKARDLFSETPGRFVVSVIPENVEKFVEIMGNDCIEIGETTASQQIHLKCQNADFEIQGAKAQKIWEETIPCLMKSKD